MPGVFFQAFSSQPAHLWRFPVYAGKPKAKKMRHTVTVYGKPYQVAVHQKSGSVWEAVGGLTEVAAMPGVASKEIRSQGAKRIFCAQAVDRNGALLAKLNLALTASRDLGTPENPSACHSARHRCPHLGGYDMKVG